MLLLSPRPAPCLLQLVLLPFRSIHAPPRVYPQPHAIEIAREMIGSSQQPQPQQSQPSTTRSLPSSNSMNIPLRLKVATRRHFFRLWKETVIVQEPAKQEVDDV